MGRGGGQGEGERRKSGRKAETTAKEEDRQNKM